MVAAPEPLRLFNTGETNGPGPSQIMTRHHVPVQEALRQVNEAAKLIVEAQARLAAAVTAAHDAGCTWRRIGIASGVPYQTLHRKFAEHAGPDLRSQANS